MTEFNGEVLLILGAGVMQGPALFLARGMGLYTVAVDGDPNAPERSQANRFEHIDLNDKEGIAALGQSLQKEGPLGVMTAGTDFSASVAWVAEKLGLPGIPYEAALNASDKDRMRRCFKAAGVPSPQFTTFTAGEILSADASSAAFQSRTVPSIPFDFPAVVKPVDNMGSRGCRRVNSPEELAAALPEALKFSRSGKAIVEEYMDGPEFSVDAIVYKDEISVCGFADRHIFFPPYFIEMGHTIPSNLNQGDTDTLLEAFFAGIRTLGITAGVGAAKGDLKLTSQGPMIGEIAARLSGGYMSGWTFPYSSGLDLTKGAIRAALGRRPQPLTPNWNWTSAERAFISIPGRVRSIHGLDQAKNTGYVKNLFLRAVDGGSVCFPENNVSKCGNIISAAPNRDAAINAAETAARSVLIHLEPANAETDAFLAASAFAISAPAAVSPGAASAVPAFPPDAYALTTELRNLLDRFPESKFPERNLSVGGPGTPIPVTPEISIYPFPEFTGSGLRDYTGRTIDESIAAIRTLTELPLPITERISENSGVLGRRFWAALIRGGYQGGAYVVDSILKTYTEPEARNSL